MAKIKVADYIVRFIAEQGVKHVFLVTGGGNLPMVDAIRARKDLQYVATHHEQAAAMAAEAYARVNENLGVCCVTFGPGATNTLTGVAGAWLDSIPVLFISGQVKREHMATGDLRQLGVQEVNIIDMVKPITKYAAVVSDPNEVVRHLTMAVSVARMRRPGPVFLDIPSDVQNSYIEDTLPTYGVAGAPMKEWDRLEVLALLSQSKRPLIFAGHGITLAKARKEFRELVDKFGIPVVTSMLGHDLLPTAHSLYIGRPGVFGDRAGNLAVQNADLILSIGVRHGLWNIGYDTKAFGKHAKKIVVDIDAAELDKPTYVPDLAIQEHAGIFIERLLEVQVGAPTSALWQWGQECRRWKQAYPVNLPEYADQTDYVNSYHFTTVLSHKLANDEIIFTGVGTSFTGTLQSIRIKGDQRFHCNVGCAAMGYDLPAAIGASFAADKKRIVLLTGDGGIMMNLQELQTIAHHNLPIKIFLLNNAGYLAIKNTQNAFYGGRLAAVDEDTGLSFPDFSKVATAFGIRYSRIANHQDDMEAKIQEALDYDGPTFVDLTMSPSQPLWPKMQIDTKEDGSVAARGLEDMAPLLTRAEFSFNMRHTS
jgi:acetolactate synthase-1/2/3 large subunit